ncbi:MAG: D-ribose-binding periplasmic protein precursor [Planctomycetota bacterium]
MQQPDLSKLLSQKQSGTVRGIVSEPDLEILLRNLSGAVRRNSQYLQISGGTDDLSEILTDHHDSHLYRQSVLSPELYQSAPPIQPDRGRRGGFGCESAEFGLCSDFHGSNPPLGFDPGPPGLYRGVLRPFGAPSFPPQDHQTMKRGLLLLALAFAGCQVQDSQTSQTSGSADAPGDTTTVVPAPDLSPAAETPVTGRKMSVAFVTNQIADFWKISEAGCITAAKEFDMDVQVIMPPEATAVVQKQKVEDAIAGGIQAIAISPLDADNQIEWLNSLAEKMPLITHDSDAPASERLVYIGMDNYAAGRACGEILKRAVPDGGQILICIGRLEQDNSRYRRQGVIDVLMGRDRTIQFYKDNPSSFDPVEEELKGDKYTIVATLTDQGKPEVALQKAEDALVKYPDLKGMAGLFEYNPPACYQALKKAERLKQIALAGFDENDVTLQAIRDGECAGTVVQNPYEYGYQSVKVLKEILSGNQQVIPPSRYIDIAPRSITAENVDTYWEELKRLKGQ